MAAWQVVQGQKMMEGAGVRICRTLGTSALRNLDPFLMLDELRMPASEATSGFPDHPHRGFETCSIMLTGKMQHRDNFGNEVTKPRLRVMQVLWVEGCLALVCFQVSAEQWTAATAYCSNPPSALLRSLQ